MATVNTAQLKLPPVHDWRTSDNDEIARRRQRARDEAFRISNIDPRHPVFSNFRVASASGLTYRVEIRSIRERQFSCECVDFRINGLGTCKHVEAVLLYLERRFKRLFQSAARNGSGRIDIVPDPALNGLVLQNANGSAPARLKRLFSADGLLSNGSVEEVLEEARKLQEKFPELRISQDVEPWMESRRRAAERKQLRREYELRVQSGEWPAQETKVPLFPYQREGMLHLAFTERALLADEMGLGKTIQAIAACALLHRLGRAKRVLVVTPASLKTEWEEQIQRFTDLPLQLVFGSRHERLKKYDIGSETRNGKSTEAAPFFTVVNYEQMLVDALEVNARLRPDVVILDEAQRIRNWNTKTTQAIKRLRSRYAFVLTGTPIENRIDELHSLMDFLDPSVLGPLFRFNREFYELDERGRPCGYRNLHLLHERIAPYMLRRRKADVETELPERTDRNHFVPLSPAQQAAYEDHEANVARLASISKRRPLTQQEQDKLMRELAMMRMVCDTNYILDPNDKDCPKLAELEKILEECRDNGVKAIVFSEWERMLERVRELCETMGLGFAWHTGTVPQRKRRAGINAFKNDPNCCVFLSTDSGSTGLNLQNASVVINCDLPWNPVKLEQRIARAWRKHQTRAVTVINLVSENTIEHRMLETLANKQALSDGVLDLKGNLQEIKLRSGRQAFLAKLEQLVVPRSESSAKQGTSEPAPALPADRALGFARQARERINGALVCCEERFPASGVHSVLYVVVERDAAQWRERLNGLHTEFFGPDRSDPLAPVNLEVVDRATHEALERLTAAGLISMTTRSARPLFPEPNGSGPAPLSAEERARADARRQHAARKLRMATLLAEGGMADEARAPMLEAILAAGCALAIEARLPEPATTYEALLPPLSLLWGEAVSVLRAFSCESGGPWAPVAEALRRIVERR